MAKSPIEIPESAGHDKRADPIEHPACHSTPSILDDEPPGDVKSEVPEPLVAEALLYWGVLEGWKCAVLSTR